MNIHLTEAQIRELDANFPPALAFAGPANCSRMLQAVDRVVRLHAAYDSLPVYLCACGGCSPQATSSTAYLRSYLNDQRGNPPWDLIVDDMKRFRAPK